PSAAPRTPVASGGYTRFCGGGGPFPVGLSPLRVTRRGPSQPSLASRSLYSTSPVPFRGSSFTGRDHPRPAAPQRLTTRLFGRSGYRASCPFPHCRHKLSGRTMTEYSTAAVCPPTLLPITPQLLRPSA